MKINFLIIALAALVPLVMGFVWYNPKVFGAAWMKSAGLDEEKLKGGNMPLIFGSMLVLSFFIAFMMQFIVIHQWGVFSTLAIDSSDPSQNPLFIEFMEKYGSNFRTFKHGALHGFMNGLLFITPIIAINAAFERKGFKYIAINGGFWIVCLAIMGGIICQFT